MEVNLLLPQTALRIWGLSQQSKIKVNQIEYLVRRPFDIGIEETIYRINSLILREINLDKKLNYISKKINHLNYNESTIYDCHLLNLQKYYFTSIPSKIHVLDYSTLGHRTLLSSDLRYPIEFSRAVKRNLRFKKKFAPKSIIHWDDFALKREKKLINFGWENMFCDTNSIALHAKSFLKNNLPQIDELKFINISDKIMLILPHSSDSAEKLFSQLSTMLLNPKFMNDFNSANHIFIKNHRTSTNSYPSEVTFAGKTIHCFQSNFMKLLPVEILFFGLSNTVIASVNSSSIYSNQNKSFYFIPKQTEIDKKAYGLMRKRFKLKV